MKKIIVYSLILAAGLESGLAASTGSSGVQALMLDSYGSRPIALADAFTGVADDVNAISVNPAGLSTLSSVEAQVMYLSDFADQSESYLFGGVAWPFAKAFCAAVSVESYGLASFDGVDKTGLPTGTSLSAGDLVFTGAFAFDPMKLAGKKFGLNLGVAAHFIQSTLAGKSASAFAFDAGVLFKAGIFGFGEMNRKDNLGIGFAAQNIGTSVTYVSEKTGLPANLRAGIGYRVFKDRMHSVQVSADANLPGDSSPIVSAGLEYTLLGMFYVRGGYKITGPEAAGLSAGAGVSYLLGGRKLFVDYAVVPMKDLGISHAFSLGMKF